MTDKELRSAFADAMQHLLRDDMVAQLGLAVSGGSDSLAMLHLAAEWASPRKIGLHVLTFDHQLRAQSGAEARYVREIAHQLGATHDIMVWQNDQGGGNLQARARQARLTAFLAWRAPVRHVLLGHTQDDQAETFLLRLMRGSGVEGLCAIPQRRPIAAADGQERLLLRPVLGISRARLRRFLTNKNVTWVEDPSNGDQKYDRVKARKALKTLTELGLDADRLVATSGAMRQARTALFARAAEIAEKIARVDAFGDVIFDVEALKTIEDETRLRLVGDAIKWIANAPYRPRQDALEKALSQAFSGETRNLGGALLCPARNILRITRELRAIDADITLENPCQNVSWDGRWQVLGEFAPGMNLRPLGEEGRICYKNDLQEHLSFQTARALPALFWEGALFACPGLKALNPAFRFNLTPKSPFLFYQLR